MVTRSSLLGIQSATQLSDEKRTKTFQKRKKEVERAERSLQIMEQVEERERQFPEIYGQPREKPNMTKAPKGKKSALQTFKEAISGEGKELIPTKSQAAKSRVDRAKIVLEEAGDQVYEPTGTAQIYQRHRTTVDSYKNQLQEWNRKIEQRKKEGDMTPADGSPQAPLSWYEDKKQELVDKLIKAEVKMMESEKELTPEDRFSISEEAKAIGKKIEYRSSIADDLTGISRESPASVQAGKDLLGGIIGGAEAMSSFIEDKAGADWLIPMNNKMQKWQEELQPENPNFASTLFSAAGSSIWFFAPGLGAAKGLSALGKISPRVAMLIGGSVSSFLEASAEAGSVYSQMSDSTESAYKASEAATRTFWANIFLVGITNKFGVFSESQRGVLRKALMTAPIESIQEGGQQIISNAQTGKNWFDGVLESMGAGAIIGGGLGAIMETSMPSQQEVAQSDSGITGEQGKFQIMPDDIAAAKAKGMSFDEWVKGQGEVVYRGEGGGNKFSGQSGTARGKNFTMDIDRAKSFGEVEEYVIPKNAKVLRVDTRGKELDEIAKEIGVSERALYSPSKLQKELIDQGYDFFEETGRLSIDGKITKDSPTFRDIIDLHGDKLKTTSQLRKEWDSVSGALTAKQAKASGMSFDEWVKGQESKLSSAETGKPITTKVYHGSPDARFAEEFDPMKKGYYKDAPEMLPDNTEFESLYGKVGQGFRGENTLGYKGVSFTDDYKTAKSYADKPAFDYQNSVPMVLERNVTLENPKVYDLQGGVWNLNMENEMRKAMDDGYDGLVFKNIRDDYHPLERSTPTNNIIVFDTKNIKTTSQLRKEWDAVGSSKSETMPDITTISSDEAVQAVRKYFTEDEVPVAVVDRIITPDGERALGQYRQGMIQFVQNPLQSTPQHEAVHAYMDLFAGNEQRQGVLNQVKQENAQEISDIMEEQGIDENTAAEEYVADKFVEWVRGQQENQTPPTIPQKIANFFKSVWNGVQNFLGKGNKVESLYRDIIAKKRTVRNEQTRKSAVFQRKKSTAQKQKEIAEASEKTAIISQKEEQKKDPEEFDIESVVREGSLFISENFSTYELVARERFDIPKLKKISGGGSDRDVYDLGDHVLKVAKTARGLRQNDAAGDYLLEDANLIPMLRERGDNYIVVDKAEKPNDATKRIVKELGEFTMLDWENKTSKLQEYFYSEPEGVDLSMALNYDILWNDFTARRNWGAKQDGTPVHVDEGTFSGDSLINDFRDTKNLDDPEFRELHRRSREAKKIFGDTDSATMYQRLPNDPELQPLKDTLKKVTQDLEAIVSAAEAEIELLNPKTEEEEILEGLAEEVRRAITAPILPGGLKRSQFFSQLASSVDSITKLSDKLKQIQESTNSRDLADRIARLRNTFGAGTYDDLNFEAFQNAIVETLKTESKGDVIDRAIAIIGELGDFEIDEGVVLSDLLNEIDRVEFAINEKLTDLKNRKKSKSVSKQNATKTAKQSALEVGEGSLKLPDRSQGRKRKARSAEVVKDRAGNLRTKEGETLVRGRDLLEALSTLSKSKEAEFKVRLRDAVREGKKARASGVREQIKKQDAKREAIKRELIEELRERVPLEKRGKFLATVKNTKTRKQLEKALDRADREAARVQRKSLAEKIRKEIKRTKVTKQGGKPVGKFTPQIQKTLDLLREAVKMSPEQASEQIAKNIESIDKADGKAGPNIALQNKILDMVLGLEGKTPSQLQDLLDQIVALKNEGRMLNELKKFNREEEVDRQTNAVMDVLTGGEGLPDGIETTGVKEIDPNTVTEKAIKFLKKSAQSHYAYPDLLDALSVKDKGSKPKESRLSKFGDVHKIKNAEKKAQRNFMKNVRELFLKTYGLKNDKEMITKMREDSKEILLGEFVNASGVNVDIRFTRQELRKRWMELRDPSLEQTFREGMGYTDEIMFAIDEAMTEQDRNFAQAQLDFYKEFYNRVNEVYEVMYGVSLPFNEFYSPIRRRGFQAEAAAGFGEFMNEISMRRSTAPGGVKSRVKNTLSIEKRSDVSVLEQHVVQMEHFIAWAEKMRDMRAVFGNPKVQAAIEHFHGQKNRVYLEHFLNDFTRGGFDMAQRIEGLDMWRSRFTRSALAIKPFITLKQLTSAPAFAENMPVGKFVQYSAEFWKNPRANAKELYENSESLKDRGKTMDKDIQNAMRMDEYKNFRKGQRAQDMLMMNIQLGDQAAIVAGGWPYYNYLRKDLKLSQEEAIEKFEKAFESAQQSGDLENLNFWQRNSSFSRMFTMFMSTPMQYMNKEIGAIRNLKAKRISKQQAAKTIYIYHFLLPMIFQLVSDLGRWNTKEQARAMILGSFNGIFIAGDFLDMAIRMGLNFLPGEKSYVFDSNTPILTIMDGLKKATSNLTEKDVDGTDIQDAIDGLASFTGKVTGLPIQQVTRIGIGLKDMAIGDYAEGFLQAGFGVSRFQAEQRTEGKKKKSSTKKSSI